MNCFDWYTRSSDYLDGTLSEAEIQEADLHLHQCARCEKRRQHYRLILNSLNTLPHAKLPNSLKKLPKSSSWPRFQEIRLRLSGWEQIPWYIRILVEGSAIVALIVGGISAAPKIRTLYEENIEKTLSDFRESLMVRDSNNNSRDRDLPALQGPHAQNHDHAQEDDEISGENESESEEQLHVSGSQLWRFTVKTVSPDELRPQVIQTLTRLKVPVSTPGLGGMQVPGGIEFDLILPQAIIPDLKEALEKLATKPVKEGSESEDSSESDPFSWYRVKSKRKLPDGSTKVVIWLSQPT